MNAQEITAQLTGPNGPFELKEVSDDYGSMRVYAKGPQTLRDILLAMKNYGDKTYLVYEDQRLTFNKYYSQVASLAHWLLDQGVVKGDRVAIGMRNYPEWVIGFFACQAIGAVTVSLNAWWTDEELVYGLTDSGAKIALFDGERYNKLAPHLDKLTQTTIMVVHGDQLDSRVLDWNSELANYANHHEVPDVEVNPLDSATILYTSGTTGTPKGALHTHRNHITNIQNTLFNGAAGAAIAAAHKAKSQEADAPSKNESDVEKPKAPPQFSMLHTFPFFHISGLNGLYTAAIIGAKLVLMRKWDADQAIDLIINEKIKSWGGVPSVMRQVLEHPRAPELKNMASIGGGGAPVPEDLINKVGKIFKSKVAPGSGYGATETTSAVISNAGADYLARPQSIGKPAVTVSVRIVNDDGQDVPQGEVAELWIRGPNVFSGYWNRPEANEEAFSEGWFKTGDLGYVDEEGFYYVVDRKKDVIIRAGENVYCAQVEDVLHDHNAINDVAVIGLPHRELGEEVAAVVELQPGATLNEEDVKSYVAERLAYFNVPTQVFFADEPLPRTATGKVLKRDLKQKYSA